jgi:transcriptional regulator with XRE-family HTH domain
MPRAKGRISMVVKKVPKPVDKYVGSRVRMRRMMLGMSQTDLANGIGVTFQQVQKYEKGTNRMGASRLQQIANILQVPITFFFEGAPDQFKLDGKAQSPAFVTEFLATSDGLALTRAFTRLSNSKLRRSIVALVEGIAGDD